MRPASSRVATLWITVLCLLTAFFSLDGLASARQPAVRSKRKLSQSLQQAPAGLTLARGVKPNATPLTTNLPSAATTDNNPVIGTLTLSGIARRESTISSSWKGGTGNWNVSSDWSPSGVPNNGGGNTYNVTIDSGGTDSVTLNQNATINSLVLGGTSGSSELQNLSSTAETLTATGATTINETGTLSFANGSTLSTETLTVNGGLSLQGATASTTGNATFNSGSEVLIGEASQLTVNGSLTNYSYLYTGLYGGGNTLKVTGSLTNNGGLYMYGLDEGSAGDTLTVSGTLTNASGATLELYDNAGDVANIGTLSNSGTVYIGLGDTLNLTDQTNGITDVPAGSSLTVNGTITAGSANGLAKLGSIEGSLTLGNGVTTSATPSSGTLTLASGSLLTLNNSGTTLSITGGLSDSGTVTVNSGATLNLTQSMTDLPASGTFTLYGSTNALAELKTVEGFLELENGQTTSVTPSGGTLTFNSGSEVLIGEASQLTVNGSLTNYSYLYTGLYGGGNTLKVTGSLTNNGGLYMYGLDEGSAGDTLTVSGTLTNASGATLELYDNAGDVANIHTLTNSGTIDLNSGTVLNLTASETDTNSGTIYVGDATGAATLEITASAVTLSGAGSIVLANNAVITGASSSDTLTNDSTISGTGNIGDGQIVVVNKTGTINANVSGQTLTVQSGGAGTTNDATMEATGGGILSVVGKFTNYTSSSNTLSGGTYIANGAAGTDVYLPLGTSGGITTLSASVTEEGGGLILNSNNSNNNALNGLTTITSTGALTIGGVAFTDTGNFSNAGSLTILGGEVFKVATLSQISGGSLTAGTYVLDANLDLTGATQTVTTNAANLTLAGGTIENANSTNALAGLATNTGTLTIGGTSNSVSTTASSFSNTGTMTIDKGDSFTAAKLTQISGTKLSGGTFTLIGNLDLTTSGISVTTNSSNLTLEGGTINSNGVNALSALASNTDKLTIDAAVTTSAAFSNTGTLTIDKSESFTAKSLTQISSGDLTAGTYVLAGNLDLTTSGITVTTNETNLTLEGGTINSNGVNALSALASNTGTLTIDAAVTTTATSFSNTGTLTIDKSESFTAPALTQISGTTLTAGTYVLAGNLDLTGTANITTNSAKLTLEGGEIKTGSTNDLANLNSNTGTLTLASDAKVTTSTTANFTNTGTVDVEKGSTLTVGGTSEQFNQTAGTTTVDGTLTTGSSGSDSITGGTVLGAGTIKANTTVGNASGTAATINAGDSGAAGLLTITGTYKQLATGVFTGFVNGTTADTGYSQMKVSGTASLAGTINFTVSSSFMASLKVGQTFTVLTASSVSGTFSNSTIAINSTFQFDVSYKSNEVILTVADVADNASPAQAAVAKPASSAVAKNRVALPISGLRRGSDLSKVTRPVVAVGWAPSNERVGLSDLRVWEHVPVAVSPVRPVAVARVPSVGNEISPRVDLPSSDLRMGESRPISIQAPVAHWVGTSNRREPVKMLPTMLPRIAR